MNRTLKREQQVAQGVIPGEVVIATRFNHPVRGTVPCPAAPALTATASCAGKQVRQGPLALNVKGEPGEAVAFVVSYLDHSGNAVGFAAAAHRDDKPGLAIAEATVTKWLAVARTRRVIVDAVGPGCTGSRRALGMIESAVSTHPGRVYMAGSPAFGLEALASLNDRGVIVVNDLDQLPDGATVAFPPHGVPLRLRAEAGARGLGIIDTTCPLAAEAHADVRRFADRGDTVILVGQPSDAAVESLAGQAPENVIVVHDVAGVKALRVTDPGRLSYVVDPGMVAEDAAQVVASLRRQYPRVRGMRSDRWCYAASDRVQTVRAVAAASDLVLVLGRPRMAETRSLARLATASGTKVQHVGGIADLTPGPLADASTIGLVVADSALRGLGDAVVGVLSGLGPLSVVRWQVSSHVAAEVAPQALARRARLGGKRVTVNETRSHCRGAAQQGYCGGIARV